MLFCFCDVFAQKQFDLTVTIDSTIDINRLNANYSDGKSIFPFRYQFTKDAFRVKGALYAEKAYVQFQYNFKNAGVVDQDFFIGSEPAVISLSADPDNGQLKIIKNKNASLVYDTSINPIYKEITDSSLSARESFNAFMENDFAKMQDNDSLKKKCDSLMKRMINAYLPVLKKYSQEYFSFWYFNIQAFGLAFAIDKTDTAYINDLITYFNEVFPDRFKNSVEGKILTDSYESFIHPNPIKINQQAPPFSFKDIHGNKIDPDNYKGKNVLLDFWGTWCGPCMREVPFIKALREKYSQDELTIIGVSTDYDSSQLVQTIHQQQMNWTHIFDKEHDLTRLYKIEGYPTLILINKKGNISFMQTGLINDDETKQKLYDLIK